MTDKKKFEQTLHFISVFLLRIFDKEANIRCSIGSSISRPMSSRDHNATDQEIAMDRYQSFFRKLDNFFYGNNKVQ